MTENNNFDSHILNRPFDAYKGDDPYIFASYKHADYEKVYPVLKMFKDAGFNIWYDADLPKGKYYDIQIAQHIKKSALFVTFITEEAIACSMDEDDYLIKELTVAINTKRQRLPIFLDNVELDGYYLMHYLGKQSILKYEYGDNEDKFLKACVRAFTHDFGIQPNIEEESDDEKPQNDTQDDTNHTVEMSSPAYTGSEPYIFVSYDHKDANEVFSDIKQFQNLGYNVWYDEGLTAVGEWMEHLVDALSKCSLLVYFVSSNSVQSRSVTQEVVFALKHNIPVLPIYLEETELNGQLNLQLCNVQSILKFYLHEEYYIQTCSKAFEQFGLKNSKDNIELINQDNNEIIERLTTGIMKHREMILADQYRDEIRNGNIPDAFFDIRDNLYKDKDLHEKDAKSRLLALNNAGFNIVDKNDKGIPIRSFDEPILLELAVFSHNCWVEDKINEGWTYSKITNRENKTNCNLLPWERLNREIQKYAMDSVNDIFKIVDYVDLKVISSSPDAFISYASSDKNIADELPLKGNIPKTDEAKKSSRRGLFSRFSRK